MESLEPRRENPGDEHLGIHGWRRKHLFSLFKKKLLFKSGCGHEAIRLHGAGGSEGWMFPMFKGKDQSWRPSLSNLTHSSAAHLYLSNGM